MLRIDKIIVKKCILPTHLQWLGRPDEETFFCSARPNTVHCIVILLFFSLLEAAPFLFFFSFFLLINLHLTLSLSLSLSVCLSVSFLHLFSRVSNHRPCYRMANGIALSQLKGSNTLCILVGKPWETHACLPCFVD